MPTKTWKQFERDVADVFGGKRRGAYTGGADGGKTDVIHDHFAIECKLLGSPGYADMLKACRQAEANAEPGQEPVAVIKRKSRRLDDALVVYRLSVFKQWRLGDG